MSIKKIITVPDETLKKISEPIEKFGVNEKKLINDLLETMYHSKGIGLAAVQVGIPVSYTHLTLPTIYSV